MLHGNSVDRGIVISNQEDLHQVFAWDVTTGKLSQRTDRPEGMISASIAPDGRFICYLNDQLGNEIGHFVRIPYEGGKPEDITPDLPPYNPGFSFSSPIGLAISRTGNRMAFTAGTEEGFRVYVLDVDETGIIGEPREIYHCEQLICAPVLSHSGEVLVFASTERYQKPLFSLLAFDAVSGEQIGELWEGDDHSVTHLFFSPVAEDMRVAGLTDRSGVERLVLWNPVTGERTDPALADIAGAMNAFDWSPDGKRVLFRTFNAAVQQLYIYRVEEDAAYRLNHPSGTNFSPYFGPQGDINSHLATATHPSHLVVLDVETGSVKETPLEAGDVPPGRPWTSFAFTSMDGQDIQGWQWAFSAYPAHTWWSTSRPSRGLFSWSPGLARSWLCLGVGQLPGLNYLWQGL
jgi:Tol biopolymer transport system component